MEKKLFTIAMILLLSLSMLAVLRISVAKTEVNLTFSDAMLNVLTLGWSPGGLGTLVKTDVSGLGVEFNLTGLSLTSGSGCNNNFPVNQLAGGDPDDDSGYGNFSRYTNYRLVFKNQGTNDVQVQLFMNTGFTGAPFNETNNWNSGSYVTVAAGQTEVVTMDLSAVPYLYHVSNIGFQVLDSGGAGTASLVVCSSANLYMDPLTVEMHINSTNPVGSTFEMTAKVENVTDLYGLDIRITWDNTLISYDHESYTGLLSGMWGPTQDQNWTVMTHEGGIGYYRFIAVSLNNSFTGSHGLFTVGFKINDPGTNSMRQTSVHFDIHKLSDKASQAIAHDAEDGTYQVWGQQPTLDMLNGVSNSRTCREVNETFNLAVKVYNAENVTDFEFEIHFNASQVKILSITYTAWGSGSGTASIDNINGIVTGSTSGSATNGTATLITIQFNTTLLHIWKALSGWQNLQTSTIFIQAANLSYPNAQPKLQYVKSGMGNQITVNPDFTYTFSPIKGDLNNDGKVDVSDLGVLAPLYDSTDHPQYNLVDDSSNLIDIFDLVVVASNFWYVYTYPGP
jgi:hypothetical protein